MILYPIFWHTSDIRLEVFTDAAFGNLHDGGSRGGYLIFVSDGLRSAPLDWSSHRLKRVARSTLAAEAQALLDGISGAMYYRQLLMEIGNLEKPPQVICYSDCKSLVESSQTTNVTKEKRLRIDLALIRESLERGEITIQWVNTKSQLADSLTKGGVSTGLLKDVLKRGSL